MRLMRTNNMRNFAEQAARLVVVLVSLSFGWTTAARGADMQTNAADTVALAMLKNIQENGFNPDPRINGGLGGLWINWRMGTKPLLVNFNGSGSPDKIDPPRHDELTDLRYLHNLLSWKHQHPQDIQFDGELKRFDAIVKREFANTHNERGWIRSEEHTS